MNHQYEKYRMEETMSQQTKLIDFLQDKVESTPRKKKWVKIERDIIFYVFFPFTTLLIIMFNISRVCSLIIVNCYYLVNSWTRTVHD